MDRIVRTAAIAFCVGLAGCANTPSTFNPSDPHVKIDSFYSYGAGGRDLLLIVDGDPFPVPDAVFAQKVESSLDSAPVPRQPTHPLLAPDDTANPRFWLIYVFNPPANLSGNDICQRGTSGATSKGFAPAQPGKVEAVAAFCVEGRALTEITGRTQADGPDDPRFREMTRLMMAAVFRSDINWETGAPPPRM
jgi:hypothetical protein